MAITALAGTLAEAQQAAAPSSPAGRLPELRGTDFDLRIGATPVNITGAPRMATTVNGSMPAPVLYWKEGTTVTLRVTNALPVRSSIHWHGILVPPEMDGVPGLSFEGIAPGETFVYRIPVRQSGTYWYHSHSGFQEQTGLFGALVIEPAKADPVKADREHVMVLSDWTDEDPDRVFEKLKAMSDYYNYQIPTVGDFFRDVSQMGWSAAVARRREWNRMRMNPTDLADISAATYTYLVNGAPPAANWLAEARPGERVRLRIVNSAASSIFDVRIPGLQMTVVSADGQPVQPVAVDELRISTAETYDVLVTLPDDRAYTFFAQAIDRMGFARATLAPRPGMQAAVPALDPPVWLTMEDMGMGDMEDMPGMQGGSGMKGMQGSDMPGMPGMQKPAAQPAASAPAAMPGHDMSKMQGMQGHDMANMPGMQRPAAAPAPSASAPAPAMPGHDMSKMPGMQRPAAAPAQAAPAPAPAMPGDDMSKMPGMQGRDMGNMPGMQKPAAAPAPAASAPAMPGHDMSKMQGAKGGSMQMDTGPAIDNRAMSPGYGVADPGPRLRGNGRRVLTYADLHTVGGSIDRRPPGREIELRLTGNMRRFIWGFDGKKYSEAEPIRLRYGERVRIVLVNDTMMSHPIHLHGMWSEIETEDGAFLVRKHTVNVHPGKRIAFGVTADARGQWAFHCHHLYHMEAGMFRKVVVE